MKGVLVKDLYIARSNILVNAACKQACAHPDRAVQQ